MKNSLTILDDFFPDFDAVRAFALSHDFTQEPEYDGHAYPGFAQVKDERFAGYMASLLAEATGCNVGIKIAAFVAGTEAFETQQWIHADNTCASHAAVVYLFDQPGFGTAFWQHIGTKSDSLQKHLSHFTDLPADSVAQVLQTQGRSEAMWTRSDYADSRKNRLIFYPSDRFHSRYPQAAFGDEPENCRLILTAFFDILP